MSMRAEGQANSAPKPRKNNRRDQILSAAQRVLNDKGLAAVTTRAIAEAVPCSEGAIYVHFPNRLQLILTVFEEALREMLTPMHELEEQVGSGTPRENLLRAMKALQRFHTRVVPMLCSMFADAGLLAAFRATLAERQKGPRGAVGRLARYIRAEQAQGRIAEAVDADFAGAMLMAGSFFGAFHGALLGGGLRALTAARLVEEAVGNCERAK